MSIVTIQCSSYYTKWLTSIMLNNVFYTVVYIYIL